MPRRLPSLLVALLVLASACVLPAQQPRSYPSHAFPGFDRNDYPGDAALPALRKSFRYTGYWLNPPPGETANSWSGKRALLKQYGFGFLVLFNGRLDAQLKGRDAASIGAADGHSAVQIAAHEGFPPHVLIFLDQEEGGRLLPEQAAYLFAWIDAIRAAGDRPGVYCSGIATPNSISTAEDIAARETARQQSSQKDKNAERLTLWIANDQCPPSPGCNLTPPPVSAAFTSFTAPFASIWQYAQSPRRPQFSAACPANQAPDGNCYTPGATVFLDLNSASSPDPSEAP
jgi:Rv2525c-like, glycoside hydrolase-like domain